MLCLVNNLNILHPDRFEELFGKENAFEDNFLLEIPVISNNGDFGQIRYLLITGFFFGPFPEQALSG
jgi:hypothetical protein